MKKSRLSFLLLLIIISFISKDAFTQNLVWSEEFNDQSRIDPKTWIYTTGGDGFGNNELQYYTDRPQNVRVENGNLILEAHKEIFSNRNFTSGRIKTHGRFAFKYGIIEARIKLPNVTRGIWPAFWLMGNNIGQVGWPKCGEWDILEVGAKSALDSGVENSQVGATMHWFHNATSSNANYGTSTQIPGNFYSDYHTFKLDWNAQRVIAYVDDVKYYEMNITSENMTEFHQPAFILLNLAVGGRFTGITSSDLITATFPAKMFVDYIRVYNNGSTELLLASNIEKKGPYGILTENTVVNSAVDYSKDNLFIWNNMVPNEGPAFEGTTVLSFNVNAGAWYGLGVALKEDANLSRFQNGHLHMHVKTNGAEPISFGLSSSGNSGEGFYSFTGTEFGLVRDNQWHEVIIPLNKFSNLDFKTIKSSFMVRGSASSAAFSIAIDNVYLTESVTLKAPQNGDFAISTELAPRVGEFVLGTDGNLFVWEKTLIASTQAPFEGSQSLSFKSTGKGWFGFGFNPHEKYNLSAFRYSDSRLHFALKTSSTALFRIGMKSGSLKDVGQEWITFENGKDPYGFVRDGNWHIVEIPMTDITNVLDLSQVSELFQVLGTSEIANLEIDDIYFKNGHTAYVEGNDPIVTFIRPTANGEMYGIVNINATAYDPNVNAIDGAGISSVLFELLKATTVVATWRENVKTYDWSLNTKLYANGSYTLKATALSTAAAGGTSSSVSIPVIISNLNASPVVQFVRPVANSTISGTVAVNAIAYDEDIATTDGAGISSVLFELLIGTSVVASIKENSSTYDWSLNTRLYANGDYTLRATAMSTASAGGTSKSISMALTIFNSTAVRLSTSSSTVSKTAAYYPNPVKNAMVIDLKEKNISSIQIMNSRGEIVYSEKVRQQKELAINLENLKSGVYYARLIGASIEVIKFIKD